MTSCILCVHIHRVTSPFMMMSVGAYTMMMMTILPRMILEGLLTSGHRYRKLARLWRVHGAANHLGIHARRFGSCVRKSTYLQFCIEWRPPYDDFNNRSLDYELHVFEFSDPIVGSLTEYFLKYSSPVLLLFQVKARHHCTVDDDIASRDHGTCIW